MTGVAYSHIEKPCLKNIESVSQGIPDENSLAFQIGTETLYNLTFYDFPDQTDRWVGEEQERSRGSVDCRRPTRRVEG